MASVISSQVILSFFLLIYLLQASNLVARKLNQQPNDDQNPEELMQFQYHNGPLLSGNISISLVWYGKFNDSQRAIISDFITSITDPESTTENPSVISWWKMTEKYYHNAKKSTFPVLSFGMVIHDEYYSMGKSLSMKDIEKLAQRDEKDNAFSVVLTAADVKVEGFCGGKCGSHGSLFSSENSLTKGESTEFVYIWVGNSETQCPDQCAWPYHKPVYGPQTPALVAPNNDVGVDGMVINLAKFLAGAATNPYGNGYYQGPQIAPLEAAFACPGIFGKGAYPGYPGQLIVDPKTDASYNAHGSNGRKYLVPALLDPSTLSCTPLA